MDVIHILNEVKVDIWSGKGDANLQHVISNTDAVKKTTSAYSQLHSQVYRTHSGQECVEYTNILLIFEGTED